MKLITQLDIKTRDHSIKPNCELMDVVVRSEASPTWRAIEHGLKLLKEGLIWRVGSGSKIQIWRDKWIPRGQSLKITRKKGRSRIHWVNQLMTPGHREWDVGMLRQCMDDHDMQEVLKLRLSEQADDDCLAWYYEPIGIFSVRSAYKLGHRMQEIQTLQGQEGSSGQADGSRTLWRRIWQAPVPQKVRIFAWKLATNSLATQVKR